MGRAPVQLPPLEGRVVGNYTLLEQIGAGATAQVFRARHRALLTEHAVKVLTLGGASMRRRVLQEGRVQARLRHPGIVSVTDVLLIDDHPALVADFVPGPDLGRWLAARPPRAQRLAVFGAVVDAMAFAHELGVVHRDMKPENVIVDLSGPVPRPRITDFGLARLVREELRTVAGVDGHATQQGALLGTPAFMAPEQFSDASTVDARADIFALGCILYALLFDALPFPAHDLMAAAGAIQGGRYVRPLAREPDLPRHLADAVEGCLDVDRDRRVPSCAALGVLLAPGSGAADLPPPLVGGPGSDQTAVAGGAALPTRTDDAPGAAVHPPPRAPLPPPPPATVPSTLVPVASAPTVPLAGSRRTQGALALALAGAIVLVALLVPWPAPHPATDSLTPQVSPPERPSPDRPPAEASQTLGQGSPATGTSTPSPPAPTTAPSAAAPADSSTSPRPAPEPVPPLSEPAHPPTTPTTVPEANPTAAPSPHSRPAASAPAATARVTVDGASQVELRSAGQSHPAHAVPAGQHAIYARFGGGPAVHAGDIQLTAGETVHITCVPEFQQCRRAP